MGGGDDDLRCCKLVRAQPARGIEPQPPGLRSKRQRKKPGEPMRDETCANHPHVPAAATCASCGRRLCQACWCRNVDDRPWCELCIHHVTSAGNNLSVAVTLVLLSGSFAAVGWRWERAHSHHHYLFWLCFAATSCVGAVLFATLPQGPPARRVELRTDGEVRPLTAAAGARRYRSFAFRASRTVASPVSGRWTAVVLLACMTGVGVALPELLRLPRWVEVESVIAGWWVIWTIALSALLYRGWRLSDDHVLSPPRAPWRVRANPETLADSPRGREGCDPTGCNPTGCDPFGDLGGCSEAITGVMLAIALLGIAWLLIDMVAPVLFFFAYFLLRNSLARVANDHHACEGKLARALGWGAVWATLYCAPIALVIAALHAYLAHG